MGNIVGSRSQMDLDLQDLVPLNYVNVYVSQSRRYKSGGELDVRVYEVTSKTGVKILLGCKDPGDLCRCRLDSKDAPSDIYFVNKDRKHVVHIHRPYNNIDKMKVSVCGKLTNVVVLADLKSTYNFLVNNQGFPYRQKQLQVKEISYCVHRYEVQTPNKKTIGEILWESRFMEAGRRYHVTFPADLDVRCKVALIATCVFIDTNAKPLQLK